MHHGLERQARSQILPEERRNGRRSLGAASAGARRGGRSQPPSFEAAGGRYDFDTVYNRFGTDCVKFDQQIRLFGKDSVQIGMGVADMDFKAAPCITKALKDRLEHENWGYLDEVKTKADMAEAIVAWNKRRYGVDIDPASIELATGVHPALISALQTFSPRGSRVLLQTPTYDGFYTDLQVHRHPGRGEPAQAGGRPVLDGLRGLRATHRPRHPHLHPLQSAESHGQLLERRGPPADRGDLPEASGGGARRRDPLRLRDPGEQVHALRQPEEQRHREQQHHLQGGEQVVRTGRAQVRMVLLDESGPHGPSEGQPPSRPEHDGYRRQSGRPHRGRRLARSGGGVPRPEPRFRPGVPGRPDPHDQGRQTRGHLPRLAGRDGGGRPDRLEGSWPGRPTGPWPVERST